MKRIVVILMTVILLATALPASASSLFTLPSYGVNDAQRQTAPTFCEIFGLAPDVTEILFDGKTGEVYYYITMEEVNMYDAALCELNCTLIDQYVQDGLVTTMLALGDIEFTVAYAPAEQLLMIIY